MQDSSRDVASTSSSAAPSQRQVLYRKYDPVKSRRLSQLSSLNGSGTADGQPHPNSAAPPTRVLGGRPRSIGSLATISVPSHDQNDAGLPMAAESTSRSGHDYFVQQHSDSTAQSLALRQRERERLEQSRQNSYSSSGSSNGSSLRHVSVDASAQIHNPAILNGHGSSDMQPGASSSSTFTPHNGRPPPHTEESHHNHTQVPTIPIQNTSNAAATTNLPRSQSAMASLQDSTSSRHSGFRQFIPPSAYAATASSTASSPGQLPSEGNSIIKPRMSAHLSSAFARGLSNVNGILEGNTPVRLPQSASTVASAVWNKLPPAVQQLKNEIAWDWDIEDHNSSQRSGPDRSLSKSPPQGARSLSTGAVELSSDRTPEDKRPTSSASRVSSHAVSGTSSPMLSGPSTPNLADQAAHPTTLRLADQLRLDFANKQISKPSSSVVPSPVQRGKQPYRPGYQPKNGVWRDRTDEFLEFRSRRSVRGTGDSNVILHEERLYRRLEKLVDLHFPPPSLDVAAEKPLPGNGQAPTAGDRADTTGTIKPSLSLKPGDVFSRVMRGIGKTSSSKTLSASALRCE